MSLIKLTEDKFERFTLVTNPTRTYASSSDGITGSVSLFSRENRILKETEPYLSGNHFDDTVGVEQELQSLRSSFANGTNVFGAASQYMNAVSSESLSARNSKTIDVTRFTPGTSINVNMLKKQTIQNVLLPNYRGTYPSSDYAYTNYHSINFFTASSVYSSTAFIYPISYSGTTPMSYAPTSAFTLDFYINPRYRTPTISGFKAGTIFHISSTLALSLVTGSGVDQNGIASSFRLMLQLSASADIAPSLIALTGTNNSRPVPQDLVFLSNDNVLKYNTWHHVAIRWGTSTVNRGTGSFYIDRVLQGEFKVPSSSIYGCIGTGNAGALILGNYYNGTTNSTTKSMHRFFNATAAAAEGVKQYSAATVDPAAVVFDHPLNAELADVKMFGTFRTFPQIATSSYYGPGNLNDLMFYVPAFFTKQSKARKVLRTPFYSSTQETNDPFNTQFSFAVDGHILNLENFTREFVKGEYPRLYNLTASVYTGSQVAGRHANNYMYSDWQIRKRNLTILPCDNGKFIPNFELLMSGTSEISPTSGSIMDRFVTDTGGRNLQLITLGNLISTGVLLTSVSGGLEVEIYGASPEDPTIIPSTVPCVFQRTRDSSSNDIVIFDISNMFYGRRILPGSLTITDAALTGSSGKVGMTLQDDGHGTLYRADAVGDHAKWNSVGTVFYNEGIVVIKSPNIPLFGKDSFELEFKGERQIYVQRVNVTAPGGMINSSSNPNFVDSPPTGNANDADESFVYITGILLHDENMNVVARTNLAQPIIKRSTDKIQFRIKLDW